MNVPAMPSIARRCHYRPTVYWYLTFRCNLECKHCWVESGSSLRDEELVGSDLELATRNILDLQPSSVAVSGGEPLLHPEFDVVIEGLASRATNLSVETNGTLWSKERLRSLRAASDKGVTVSFGVSLDGGTAKDHDAIRGYGAFERTLQGISLIAEEPFQLYVQCVVNRRNHDNTAAVFKTVEQFNVRNLVFAFVHPVGRAVSHVDELGLDRKCMISALEQILVYAASSEMQSTIKLPPALIPPSTFHQFVALRKKGKVRLSTSCSFPLLSVLPNGRLTVCALTRNA